jgi:hypothetical protein
MAGTRTDSLGATAGQTEVDMSVCGQPVCMLTCRLSRLSGPGWIRRPGRVWIGRAKCCAEARKCIILSLPPERRRVNAFKGGWGQACDAAPCRLGPRLGQHTRTARFKGRVVASCRRPRGRDRRCHRAMTAAACTRPSVCSRATGVSGRWLEGVGGCRWWGGRGVAVGRWHCRCLVVDLTCREARLLASSTRVCFAAHSALSRCLRCSSLRTGLRGPDNILGQGATAPSQESRVAAAQR